LRKRNGSQFSVSAKFVLFSKLIFGAKKNFKLPLIFHCAGISILSAAVFLQSTVLSGILEHGYFIGTEKNVAILYAEVFLTALAISYLFYLLWRFIISKILVL
jgi:hypothetical protein